MADEPTTGIDVSVSFLVGILIHASRLAGRVGLTRLGGVLFRPAIKMSPGIRAQVWKAMADGR